MPLTKLNATQGLTGTLPAVSGANLTGIATDFVKISTSTVSSAHDYINFDSVFSSSYINYLVVGRINNTYGGTNLGVRFRASGSTESGSNYNRYGARHTVSGFTNGTSQTYMSMYNSDDINNDIAFYFFVHNPFD